MKARRTIWAIGMIVVFPLAVILGLFAKLFCPLALNLIGLTQKIATNRPLRTNHGFPLFLKECDFVYIAGGVLGLWTDWVVGE